MQKITVLFLLFLLFDVPVRAAIVSGLYESEVPVADQSAESHRQGLSTALQNVLIKLTGDSNVLGRQSASGIISQPEKYVQQYKYHNKPVFRENQLTLEKQLYLWVSFNEQSLDQALQNFEIPQWGKVRPATLVWLLVQDKQSRKFIGLEDEAGFTNIMQNQAQSRGIALLHPLLDSDDMTMLKDADIRGGFMEPVKQASQRYTPDTILVGNVEQTEAGKWQAQWTFITGQEQKNWSTESDQVDTVLKDGINQLTDTLATRYVQTVAIGNQESGLEIIVNDINSFEQYSKVLKYLRTLNSVTGVNVRSIQPGSVTFLVASSGGELVIQRAIELGSMLQSMSGAGGPYRLIQ